MLRTTAPVRHVATTSRPVHAGRQAVVVMAKKTNTEAYRRLSTAEIDSKVLELQQDLFKLRIAQSTQQVWVRRGPRLAVYAEKYIFIPTTELQGARVCGEAQGGVCIGAVLASRTFDQLLKCISMYAHAPYTTQIARLLTIKREREIVEGISKRESRANNRCAVGGVWKHICWQGMFVHTRSPHTMSQASILGGTQ